MAFLPFSSFSPILLLHHGCVQYRSCRRKTLRWPGLSIGHSRAKAWHCLFPPVEDRPVGRSTEYLQIDDGGLRNATILSLSRPALPRHSPTTPFPRTILLPYGTIVPAVLRLTLHTLWTGQDLILHVNDSGTLVRSGKTEQGDYRTESFVHYHSTPVLCIPASYRPCFRTTSTVR